MGYRPEKISKKQKQSSWASYQYESTQMQYRASRRIICINEEPEMQQYHQKIRFYLRRKWSLMISIK